VVVPDSVLKAPASTVKAEPLLEEGFREEIFYFDQDVNLPTFDGRLPDMVRNIEQIHYYDKYHSGKPWPGLTRGRNFAVRWTTRMYFRRTGPYHFSLSSSDGSMLYLDEKPIVNNGGVHPLRKVEGSTLIARRGRHRLRLEYFDKSSNPACSLKYLGGDTGGRWAPVSIKTSFDHDIFITMRVLGLDYGLLKKNAMLLRAFKTRLQKCLVHDMPMADKAKVTVAKGAQKGYVVMTAQLSPSSGETKALYQTTMSQLWHSGLFVVQGCVSSIPGIRYVSKGKLEVQRFKAQSHA